MDTDTLDTNNYIHMFFDNNLTLLTKKNELAVRSWPPRPSAGFGGFAPSNQPHGG